MNSSDQGMPQAPQSSHPAENYQSVSDVVPREILNSRAGTNALVQPEPGETPLQVIQRNMALKGINGGAVEVPNPSSSEPQESPKSLIFEADPEQVREDKNLSVKEELPGKDPSIEVSPEAEDTEDENRVPEDPQQINFKKLRASVRETKTQLQERETELERIKSENEKLKTGEILPEVIEQKEAEIARLRRYEKIVDLKLSPEYEDSYIKPLHDIDTKLEQIATDYEIPPEVVKKATTIKNRAELNRFLTAHFDDVGALEVKNLVIEAQTLQTKAQEAEKEPEEAIASLKAEHQRIREIKRADRINAMNHTSRESWSNALSRIQNEGKALELIPKSTDPEYTEKFVTPILKAASSEYGKLVSMLVDNGLEKLPGDLAYALARMCQLAHASASSLESRASAIQRAEELERNVQRNTRYERPPVGSAFTGGATGGDAPQRSAPLTGADAARAILKKQGYDI